LVKVGKHRVARLGGAFHYFAQLGLHLTVVMLGPSQEDHTALLAFSLPTSAQLDYAEIIARFAEEILVHRISPVAIFSMNGPHFGDRYGIASELLAAFERNGIDLICINCTVASITGVVHSSQTAAALQAIQGCFDVPTVNKR